MMNPLPPELILKEVEIGNKLGRGTFGIVYEVKVNGQLCAGKKIVDEDDPISLHTFKKECHRHSLLLSHPNVIKCIGFYYTEDSTLPMLVMECLPMSLDTCRLKTLPLEVKHSILQDVADGLHYLHHAKRIIHCDVNFDNILLTPSYIAKLGDFGASEMIDHDDPEPRTIEPGPIEIMPPEALTEDPKYDEKLDVFSYGCLIIHVFSNVWPEPSPQYVEDGANKILVSEWDRRSKYSCLIPSDNPLLSFARKCLQNDPQSRPAIIEAKEYKLYDYK